MLCALTVRRLRTGTFDDFRTAFMTTVEEEIPDGFVRFHMVRNRQDPDEVICFGLFDGTLEELQSGDRSAYERQQARIAPYVESVGIDGFFDVVETWTPAGEAPAS